LLAVHGGHGDAHAEAALHHPAALARHAGLATSSCPDGAIDAAQREEARRRADPG
jgi:hypothetical protein